MLVVSFLELSLACIKIRSHLRPHYIKNLKGSHTYLGRCYVILSDALAPPYSQQLVVMETRHPSDFGAGDRFQLVQVQAI